MDTPFTIKLSEDELRSFMAQMAVEVRGVLSAQSVLLIEMNALLTNRDAAVVTERYQRVLEEMQLRVIADLEMNRPRNNKAME